MAIEIITDADSGTSTVGDTAVNLAGNYAATVLGATFLWCAGFFGAYAAFIRVVTGVAVDIVGGAKIDIFTGYKLEAHGSVVTKFVRGNHYTWDVAQKFEQHLEKTATATKKTEILDQLNQTIGRAIKTYNYGVNYIAGGDITSVCKSHSTTCTGNIKLASDNSIQIRGTADLKLFGSTEVVLTSHGGIQIIAPNKITIGGEFVNIG